MAAPISVRLDDDVRATLEADAKQHGTGLATYLRNLATDRAKLVRKANIRTESLERDCLKSSRLSASNSKVSRSWKELP